MTSTLFIFFLLFFAIQSYAGTIPSLDRRQPATGFTLDPTGIFKGIGLSPTCEQVLYQNINCDNFTATLSEPAYRHSLNDSALTDAVCAATCGTALATAHSQISVACASTPELFPGYPVLALVDRIYTGWNETCLKDNATSAYCNDIIDSWTPVQQLEDMPKNETCSYCYGAKLRLMQSSPYSVYDELYAIMLDYVNKSCGGTSTPTEPLPGPINFNQTAPVCPSGNTYQTKGNDTCDSIALANSVSSASLYYTNQNLINCTNTSNGLNLCLPLQCQTYTVISTDRCVAVAVAHGITWHNIVDWNTGIDSLCFNLCGAQPSFGTTICVSPPGGTLNSTDPGNSTLPGNGNSGGHGGSGDGYASGIVDPPVGAVVAEGTTNKCGDYIQVTSETGCSSLIAPYAVTMDLFLAVNPSLTSVTACDSNLKDGLWYCLHPVRYWNSTAGVAVDTPVPDVIMSNRTWLPLVPQNVSVAALSAPSD